MVINASRIKAANDNRAIDYWRNYKPESFVGNKRLLLKIGDEYVDEFLCSMTHRLLEGDYEWWAKSLRTVSNPRNINTYPWNEMNVIFDTLLVSCLNEMTLKEVLDYIRKWCGMALDKYPRGYNKFVILVTDKWNDSLFDSYSDEFRDLAMREDFWFVMVLKTNTGYSGCLEIPFLPNTLFKSTRHAPEAFCKVNDDTEDDNLNDNIVDRHIYYNTKKLPSDFFFEGVANFRKLSGGKSSVCVFLHNKKYCIMGGSYYFAGEEHDVVVIGVWDDVRKNYSALKARSEPIYCDENDISAMSLVSVAAHKPEILPMVW